MREERIIGLCSVFLWWRIIILYIGSISNPVLDYLHENSFYIILKLLEYEIIIRQKVNSVIRKCYKSFCCRLTIVVFLKTRKWQRCCGRQYKCCMIRLMKYSDRLARSLRSRFSTSNADCVYLVIIILYGNKKNRPKTDIS